jgi:hypothetical protein
MADYFKCNNCNAQLVGLASLDVAHLGACPQCGQTDWRGIVELEGSAAGASAGSATLTEKGDTVEAKGVVHTVDAVIAPELVQQLATAFNPTVEVTEPGVDWPTEQKLTALGIHGDFVAAGLILHAPGAFDDPDSPVIAELMIQGQWSRPYRIGPVPDTVLEAAVRIEDFWDKWWSRLQERRRADP